MFDGIVENSPLVQSLRAEIERLRAQLADSVSRESVIATEQERDEAREAARSFYLHVGRTPQVHANTIKEYPWLEESDD